MLHQILYSPAARALLDDHEKAPTHRLDSADPDMVATEAMVAALRDVSMGAVASVQQWAETADLDPSEGPTDRLFAMLVGIADENKDGELTEDEQAIVDMAVNEAYSYLANKGVAESDLDAMFNSDDMDASNAAGARVMEFLASALPNGAEADDEMDDFVFGAEATEGLFDSAGRILTDAVYRKRFAVRNGKKVTVRKRVSGVVRLSAGQKLAIRKARMKSHSAGARMKRMKSMRVRKARGMSAR